MSELFRSRAGMIVAGIYLFMVLYCLIYIGLINNTLTPTYILLMILTAPWWWWLSLVPVQLGIVTLDVESHRYDNYFTIAEFAISALINALILYFLTFLLTKAYKFLSSATK